MQSIKWDYVEFCIEADVVAIPMGNYCDRLVMFDGDNWIESSWVLHTYYP